MPTVTNCTACGVRLTFEGAGPTHCPKCGAARGASAPPAPPPAPAPLAPPPSVPLGAERAEEPTRAVPPPTDAVLDSFAAGCARVRTGTLWEAIGISLGVAYIAMLRFAPLESVAIVSGLGAASGLLLLFPVIPLSVGNLLTAFGRAHMFRAARTDGAGAVMGGALALACARFVLTTVALMYFGGLALAMATGSGPADRVAQVNEDAQLARGGAALVFGYLLGLLLEATALTALATVAAVRNLRAVARQADCTALAFQLYIVAGLATFALTLLAPPAPPRRSIFDARPVPLEEVCAFLFQLAALFWYLNRQYAVHATGARTASCPQIT